MKLRLFKTLPVLILVLKFSKFARESSMAFKFHDPRPPEYLGK